ncbi:MAG: serine hydrolase [Patiriisocius sp.]|uniref:serine hydrolase n=1 Tax=Patiriisocius sp. TaxID=2822396 RepID=UPI003EF530EC
MKTLIKYSIALSLFIVCAICNAQITPEAKQEIDARIASGNHPSISVGMYRNGATYFYYSGYRDIENKLKADENTFYEIGSITKTYVALLLAKMENEGLLNVNDPVQKYIPDTLKLSDKEGNPILFKHLATHTSGLLRMPFGYNPPDLKNPFKGYYRKDMFLQLKNFGPVNVGSKYSYSNLGVALLGETLAIIKDDTFENILTSEILKPLNLNETFINLPESKRNHYALAYADKKLTPQWDFDVMAPAGALKATLPDLLKYGVSYLQKNGISAAQQKVMQTYYEAEGSQTMGLGWIKDGEQLVHGGRTFGFTSYIIIDPETETVIAIATNTGDRNVSDIANYILNPVKNKLFDASEDEAEISAEKLQRYLGTYVNKTYDMTFIVTEKDGTLFVKLNNQNALAAQYVGENAFMNKEVKAKIQFGLENNDVTTLTLVQNGNNILCNKQ